MSGGQSLIEACNEHLIATMREIADAVPAPVAALDPVPSKCARIYH